MLSQPSRRGSQLELRATRYVLLDAITIVGESFRLPNPACSKLSLSLSLSEGRRDEHPEQVPYFYIDVDDFLSVAGLPG